MASMPNPDLCLLEDQCLSIRVTDKHLAVGPYKLLKHAGAPTRLLDFNFSAPTSCSNAMRILRAMGLQKPLLLEGVPGVGKTSIVIALAKQCGKQVNFINYLNNISNCPTDFRTGEALRCSRMLYVNNRMLYIFKID